MDFYKIGTKELRNGGMEIFPDFIVGRSKDLMVRGRAFYAIWDEQTQLWSTDEYDVQRLVDEELRAYAEAAETAGSAPYTVKYLRSFGSNGWSNFRKFLNNISDNSKDLDNELTFQNTTPKKSDYASRRLPYSLIEGDYSAWDELVGTLYSVDERAKIEWMIGAIVSGDAKKIQKFGVFYGAAGTGKSTIMNIMLQLFEGYTTTFEAKALGSNNNAFATESFRNNPLLAIQQDGDLSMISDNTKLNSIISHEDMSMNEKFKASYTSRVNAFLVMGTNQPVKISDAKSGIIRRLIDIHPTGVKIPPNHYSTLISRIDFELGAIAFHCLKVYRKMGKNYYNSYRPTEMMLQTDVFFNYIEAHYDIFKHQDGVTLMQAYSLYREFCTATGIEKQLPQYKVREELRNYFDEFHDRATVDGHALRSYYQGFNANKFKAPTKNDDTFSVVMDEEVSLFDTLFEDAPAQGVSEAETPKQRWSSVRTTLHDMDTTVLHYVKVPENHIVIDFDLKNELGEKSLEMNLAAASAWPATYGELSKSGAGVHLHYTYTGDPHELATDYSTGIEVKVFVGNGSLRRKLTKCNNIPVAEIHSGLPIKEKKVLHSSTIQSEKGLRDLIDRNIRKEIHPSTKPSIDFIHKILEDAHNSGMAYDLTDLRAQMISFALTSSNQAEACLRTVKTMKWSGGEKEADGTPSAVNPLGGSVFVKPQVEDKRLVFFDLEVYPNLFVICWEFEGDDNVVRMINPSSAEVESLYKYKLVGFYNRRYDNHILYAAGMGYTIEQLYALSQKLINGENGGFGEAYNLSYTDIWDYSSKKQSLKLFEIELGIKHMEMSIPWDQPVPDDMVEAVVEYCCNDVRATAAVHESRRQDFVARQILAELSGLPVNSTTQQHTARIIFGNDKTASSQFVYTNLARQFEGYTYDMGKSTYRGEVVGEGGYVYAEPGIHENVVVLDVASMHPTSIEQLNLFGPYTKNFSALKSARIAIKHKDFDAARKMLGGKLKPFLEKEDEAVALSFALKIVINIVYGLTAAKFDNAFKDRRNKDNIVAKRGALFMIDLKHFVQEKGFVAAHIKTDSIKIPGATPEIIQAVVDFGKQYGYDFEVEDTYAKMCLVNEAVYIAKKDECITNCWTATGAQFAHPYVFKTLFTNEDITFGDLSETRSVAKGAMWLDFDAVHKPMFEDSGSMQFVGRTGRFIPVTEKSGGAVLHRVYEGKNFAVTGTKNHLWMEAEMAAERKDDVEVDLTYFDNLADKAVKTIEKFGSFENFIK